MKGILLAGGSGTRLYPLTKITSKQLLPVYDKPMIYYPLSTLMLFDIREILIISTPQDTPNIERMLGDGSQLGLKLSYVVQPEPKGIAQAFTLGADFVGDDDVCLILGDNIFYMGDQMKVYRRAISIEEKPKNPKSNYASVGLYFYPGDVCKKAAQLQPSARGELEITDLNNLYLNEGRMSVVPMGRGIAWLDAGTPDSLSDAGRFVQMIEKRQGLKLACIEEIAYHQGFIDDVGMLAHIDAIKPGVTYRDYLMKVFEERHALY